MRGAIVAKIIDDLRRVLAKSLATVFLAVENTEGIFIISFAAGGAKLIELIGKIVFQSLVILLSALGATHTVDIKLDGKFAFFQNGVSKLDNFRVGIRARAAVNFHAELVMFSQSPFLRVFVTKNGRDIIHFKGHSVIEKSVFDKTSRNTRRSLGF